MSNTLMLTGSLNDNDKIDLGEDDDNLDDVTEALDEGDGDYVLEDDQDAVGWQLQQS